MRFTTLLKRPSVRGVLPILAVTVASLLAAPDRAVSLSGPATTSTAPHPDWTASADSEQPNESPASNAIDGNPATVWHTQYAPTTSPLPHALSIDMHATNIVAGLRYQPRADHPNGRIGNYQIHLSADGTTWGNPVATGTFADNATEQFVSFVPKIARYVRLTALSEAGNRGPWSSAAEVNLVLNPVPTLSRAGWTVASDSAQPGEGPAGNAIDGNPGTLWHTQYAPTSASLPHTFTIDMHGSNTVSGLRYQPRTDHPNGRIGSYQVHLSTDGATWGNPVATGTFIDDSSEKAVLFTPTTTRYVRLTALSEGGNRGPYSSAAEINLTNNPVSAVQCASSALIYTTRSTGAFVQYQHRSPENGSSSWAGQQQIATFGLDARRLAGPDGVIYSFFSNGELRRQRWNGTNWDTFANGLKYEIIDTNPLWSRYTGADFFNRITVDALGDIYTVEPDNYLHWRRYDRSTRTWAHRVVDSSWDSYDIIVAAGKGVVYSRDKIFGRLRRYEYHVESQRSWAWTDDGWRWDEFSRMFSPGADILYAVQAGTGNLVWYRFDPATTRWTNGTVDGEPMGMPIGSGWQGDFETVAAPDTCRLLNSAWPIRPQVTSQLQAPVTLDLSSNGHLRYSYADDDGRAVYAEAADLTGGTPIRLAAVPGVTGITGTTATAELSDGRIQIVGNGLDAEVRSNTQAAAGGLWGQANSVGGFFATPVPLVRWWGDTPTVFAVDANGLMWSREQSPWRCFDDGPNAPRLAPTGVLIVLSLAGGYLRVVGQDSNGTIYARSKFSASYGGMCHDQGQSSPGTAIGPACLCNPTWTNLGGTNFVGPASVVLLTGDKLQVVATGSDGAVYTQREGASGFAGTWTRVSTGVTSSGRPSAILAPDGTIKIVVRGTDGFIYYTSQTAPDATIFDAWQAIPDSDETGTDPTALAVPGSNTWVVAYRTDLDVPRLRRYVPGTPGSPAAAASIFADIPMTPPAT